MKEGECEVERDWTEQWKKRPIIFLADHDAVIFFGYALHPRTKSILVIVIKKSNTIQIFQHKTKFITSLTFDFPFEVFNLCKTFLIFNLFDSYLSH